jgi:hypothetical protein
MMILPAITSPGLPFTCTPRKRPAPLRALDDVASASLHYSSIIRSRVLRNLLIAFSSLTFGEVPLRSQPINSGGHPLIHVGIAQRPSAHEGQEEGKLILNEQVVEESLAYYIGGNLHTWVDDETAITLLSECTLGEISDHFGSLHLLLPESFYDDVSYVEVRCRDYDGGKILQFAFECRPDPVHWDKPWSIVDLASTLKKVAEDRSVPTLYYYQLHETDVLSMALRVDLDAREETVEQALEHWLPTIKNIFEEVVALLVANVHKGALVALFRFAPEVKTACEQYLLYFVQFLEDLGIPATAELQEQARGVLFTVTPQSGPEALERIREALEVYLRIPQSPDFDTEVTHHADIAVQQYAANVLHLRSQLTLAKAVLEAKDATIEALQAANLQYKQLLSANPQSQGQLAGSGAGNTQGDETILGGTVAITKYKGKGFEVNLPLIFRTLRRTFKREER